MKEIGMALLIGGAVAVLAGLLLMFGSRFSWPGHLPGDIHLNGKNWSFSFPVATCILISIVITVLLNIILHLFRR
ncbi:MAG: hypothetical protein PWQ29_350 [Verrucomicrobiota bacterium]|jgi:hypothetical protein|nr:hypothetical protein [Verrucomicrobiota bacterium]MDK2962956.1 hypothetical protein [Verrucomicrobiota bacterium]